MTRKEQWVLSAKPLEELRALVDELATMGPPL